jgi:DtxR family transcriptional regulator, Mn-dependent transcriptional regulator
MQTFSEENYLKAIYRIDRESNEKVTPTAISEALGNNPASVIDMLKKLGDKKLISYNKTKGAKLTDKGTRLALEVLRRHRLWEVFLLEILSYSWDEVHDIAEQLEHAHHPELADRLDKFLGLPKYDPHGDPIPESNGRIANKPRRTLSDMETGKLCQVVGVKDSSTSFLQYLQKLNVGIGTKIKITEKITFDQSLSIVIGKTEKINVSKLFAENIFVEPVSA